MAEYLGLLMIVAGVAISTAVLLGGGIACGYRLGLQAKVIQVPIVAPTARHAELSAQVKIYKELAHTMHARSGVVIEQAAKHSDSLPPSFKQAIDGLMEATTKLGKQLEQFGTVSPAANRQSPPAVVTTPRPIAVQALTPLAFVAPPVSPEKLSGDEINSITRGTINTIGSGADQPGCRYPYDCFQTVYPCYDGDAPDADGITVRCRDISSSGIAFLLPDNPDFERFVISLGDTSSPIYMNAKVIHSKSACLHGQVGVLVGCRFTGRIATRPWHPAQPDARQANMLACAAATPSEHR